jgi:putative spermidine/putrescine transport system permease protein
MTALAEEREAAASRRGSLLRRFDRLERFASWLSIAPLVLVLVPFFVVPMLAVVAASFMGSDGFGGIIPHPSLDNYKELFTSMLTLNLYLSTLKFTLLTWLFTFLIGFGVAYFLAFHVHNALLSTGLFLVCTIPFWTSNVIRMISWIPLLGQQGLVNMFLTGTHLVHQPLKFLLFSDFSVVVAYVHQLTIFMIVPIYSSLARVDKRVVEAALDAGASRWDILRLVILPLAKSGIALGSVFVTSIVMGDFFVVKVMSGGNSGSVVAALFENISVLQYPTAAAQAVVLMLVVSLIATVILRSVDVRREIAR